MSARGRCKHKKQAQDCPHCAVVEFELPDTAAALAAMTAGRDSARELATDAIRGVDQQRARAEAAEAERGEARARAEKAERERDSALMSETECSEIAAELCEQRDALAARVAQLVSDAMGQAGTIEMLKRRVGAVIEERDAARAESAGRLKALDEKAKELKQEWTRAEAAEAERDAARAEVEKARPVIRELRQKLALAGVEGSPPPGGIGEIPELRQRLREAESSLSRERAELKVAREGAADYERSALNLSRELERERAEKGAMLSAVSQARHTLLAVVEEYLMGHDTEHCEITEEYGPGECGDCSLVPNVQMTLDTLDAVLRSAPPPSAPAEEPACALRDACRQLLAVAYVGEGKIVCPSAFLPPIRAIYEAMKKQDKCGPELCACVDSPSPAPSTQRQAMEEALRETLASLAEWEETQPTRNYPQAACNYCGCFISHHARGCMFERRDSVRAKLEALNGE